MSIKIISGPEWSPLQVEEGLSESLKKRCVFDTNSRIR